MRRGYVDSSLGQIHYCSDGSGEPLILLAQAGRSSRMFTRLLPRLAPHYQVIALDMPGFGNSDPLPAGTSIESLARCVVDALDGFGLESAHLYGLHTGNKIAAAVATAWPQRVRRVVFAGQSHSLIPDQQQRNDAIYRIARGYLDQKSDAVGGGDPALGWARAFQRITGVWWSEDLVAGGMDWAELRHARMLVLEDLQAADGTASVYRANFNYDLGSALAAVEAPALILEIVTPEEDELIGRQGSVLLGIMRNATLEIIEEPGGQALTLENRPIDLAQVIRSFIG